MGVIDRYLAKEVLQTMLAVLGVFLLIFMGRYFALYLADVTAGKMSREIVVQMLLLRTMTSLSVMLPFSLFIAVLLAFGRLYKDNEMTALAACGVGMGRVVKTVSMLSLLCSAPVAVLSLWGTPWAYEKELQLREASQIGTAFTTVAEGQFNVMGNKGEVFYVEKLSDDHSRLNDVFIQSFSDGKQDIVSAKSGYEKIDPKTGERYLVLVDGYRYQGLPGQADFKIHKFAKNAVRLEEQGIAPLNRKRWAIPTEQLWASVLPADQAELQWRFAMPMATVLLAVLGVFLSKTSPRQGRFSKLFVAILIFVVYYNSLFVAMSWMEHKNISAAIGLWWVHAGLAMLLIQQALRHWGSRWVWHRIFRREVMSS